MIELGQLRGWPGVLASISRGFLDEIDLAEADTLARVRESFRIVHATWLELCLDHRHDDIPVVSSALQGREMAGLLLHEEEIRRDEFLAGDWRRKYLDSVGELRELRLRMKSMTS